MSAEFQCLSIILLLTNSLTVGKYWVKYLGRTASKCMDIHSEEFLTSCPHTLNYLCIIIETVMIILQIFKWHVTFSLDPGIWTQHEEDCFYVFFPSLSDLLYFSLQFCLFLRQRFFYCWHMMYSQLFNLLFLNKAKIHCWEIN